VTLPPIRSWRYAVDKEKRGDTLGWSGAEFADSAWKLTDPCLDTWADLALADYYGTVWYRAKVSAGEAPAGKKTFIWLSGIDGEARIFVNGKPAGETPSSFSAPHSIDISALVRANAENQITIAATRTSLNEVGTGGLLGPVLVYRER
jgi:beta-galactosidase/beta-glucuronidase